MDLLPNYFKDSLKRFSWRLNIYLENTSLHGLKYTLGEGIPWIERIFWIAISAVFFYFTYTFTIASWRLYVENPTSFGMDTAYLTWNTSFPAVSVCEADSSEKIFNFGNAMSGEDRNLNIDSYYSEIIFFGGTCHACKIYCDRSFSCPDNHFELAKRYRAVCEELITDCKWDGQLFNCCQHFLPVSTDLGICYTFNSIQSKSLKNIDFISNKLTGPGRLQFKSNETIEIFLHSPEDVPFILQPEGLRYPLHWSSVLNLVFKVVETENDPDLRKISVKNRECRFPDENPLKRHSFYSYSACIVECRARTQMRLCGCVPYNTPGQTPKSNTTCDHKGLACLDNHALVLRRISYINDNTEGLVCNCLPSCTEIELYPLIKDTDEQDIALPDDEYVSEIQIMMASLPTIKFRRNVVRDELDLTVSLGAIGGLFFGAGLLSIVEIVYYFCIRPLPKVKDPSENHKNSVLHNGYGRKNSIFAITSLPKNTIFPNSRFPRRQKCSYERNILKDLFN